MKNDDFGDRMKRYEDVNRNLLTRRTYTIIRIDGKAFHTYTRGLNKPFDDGLIEDMRGTTEALCRNIQGCKFGYTQSDEISLVLTDFDSLYTSSWFDGNIQKMASVSASIATVEFNRLRLLRTLSSYTLNANIIEAKSPYDEVQWSLDPGISEELKDMTWANFDSRVFTIPSRTEVLNYLLWRQNDASKNSISMVAQSLYSPKELEGKNSIKKKEMILAKSGKSWEDYPVVQKHGTCVYKANDWKIPDLEKTLGENGKKLQELFENAKGRVLVEEYQDRWRIDKKSPRFNNDWKWFDDKIPQLT